MFQQTRRLTFSALLVGATILGAGGAALDGHATALARAGHQAGAARHPGVAVKHPVAKQLRKLAKLRRQVLTVTSVTGSTIAATTRAGITVTIFTSSSTTFTEAGSAVTLAAVQPREHILVRGAANRAARSVQATKILIVVPAFSGVVTNVAANSVTLAGRDAVPHTFTIPGGARIEQGGKAATMQAVTVGTVLMVQGTTAADGSFTVLRAVIRLRRLAGTITAVNGASFTLRTPRGATYTVSTSSATIFTVRLRGVASKPSTTAPAITTGERALVAGTLSADGTAINAVRVAIAPARPRAATGTPAAGA